MISADPNNPTYKDWIEMENPGEMRGTLALDGDIPVLFSGDVGYDVTLKIENLPDMAALVGQEVVATTEEVKRAGMIAPQLGHVIVTAIRTA